MASRPDMDRRKPQLMGDNGAAPRGASELSPGLHPVAAPGIELNAVVPDCESHQDEEFAQPERSRRQLCVFQAINRRSP